MSDVIDIDGHRIDEASQSMLLALGDGPLPFSKLKEQTDLDEYSQVSYRIDEHLLSAGLVREVDAVERTVELTAKGQHHVEREEMNARTLDEVREIALDASEETDDLADEIEAFEDRITERMEDVAAQPELHDRLDELEDLLSHDPQDEWIFNYNFNQLNELESEISTVDERVDELKNSIEDLRDDFESTIEEEQENREMMAKLVKALLQNVNELEEEVTRLDEETISDLQAEIEDMQDGRLSKLFG